MTRYRIVEISSPQLVLLDSAFGRQWWTEGRCRECGPRVCPACELPVVAGELAYRPIGNPLNRAERIHAGCMEKMKNGRTE